MSIFNKYINITFFVAVLILSLYSCKDRSKTILEQLSKEKYERYTEELYKIFDYQKSEDDNIKQFYSQITQAEEGWKFAKQTWVIKETDNEIVPFIATTKISFFNPKEDNIRSATVTLVGSPDTLETWELLGYVSDEYDFDENDETSFNELFRYYALERNKDGVFWNCLEE